MNAKQQAAIQKRNQFLSETETELRDFLKKVSEKVNQLNSEFIPDSEECERITRSFTFQLLQDRLTETAGLVHGVYRY